MPGSRIFGYWMPVTDETSAREAVRMAGLPVLLMGANAALLALVSAVRPTPDTAVLASSSAIAILLVLLAFRIRAGHAAWLPIALIPAVAFFVVKLWLVWTDLQAGEAGMALVLERGFSWIIPCICLILMAGGLRGWRWMRTNNSKRSF